MTRTAFDVADPVQPVGGFDICCFYLGGMAAHVWTKAQLDAQTQRWRLPIWVYDPTRDPLEQAKGAVDALAQLNAPGGVTIAFDLETRIAVQAVNTFADRIHAGGDFTMPYGSTSTLFYNPVRSGYWVADPTGHEHFYEHPHVRGTQYDWHGTADTGQTIDLSVFDDTLPLWDTRPVTPPPASWSEEAISKLNASVALVNSAVGLIEANTPN